MKTTWVRYWAQSGKQGPLHERYDYHGGDEIEDDELRDWAEDWAAPILGHVEYYRYGWERVDTIPEKIRLAKLRRYQAQIDEARQMMAILGEGGR